MRVRAEGRFPVGSMVWRRRPDAHFVTVVCTVTHVLTPDRSPLAEEQPPPRDADMPWDDHGGSLWGPSDLVPRKKGVDVIVGGHAFPAGGAPVTSLTARLIAGAINKAVVVRGDRYWTPDGRLTAAEPFTMMPLRWELAGGGPGSWNPVGVPPDPQPDAEGRRRAPNLLLPRATLASPSQEVAPAGLGAVAPWWPERAAKLGPHAATWKHDRWAEEPLPEEVEWPYFNAAPPDQQLDAIGPVIALALEHLHAEHAMLITELAPATPAAFVKRGRGEPMELPLTCDTVWIDSYRGTSTLTFRGFMRLLHREEDVEIIVTEGGEPGRAQASVPAAIDEPTTVEVEQDVDESASTLVGPAVETSAVEELAAEDVLEEEDDDEEDESTSTLVRRAIDATAEPPADPPTLPDPALEPPNAPATPPARPGALVLGRGMLSSVKLGAAPRRGFFEGEDSTGTFVGALSNEAPALPFKGPAREPAATARAESAPKPAPEDSTRTIDVAALTRAAAPVPFRTPRPFERPETTLVGPAGQSALPFRRADTAPVPPAAEPVLPFKRADTVPMPPAGEPSARAPGPPPAAFRRTMTWQPEADLKAALPFSGAENTSSVQFAASAQSAPLAPAVEARQALDRAALADAGRALESAALADAERAARAERAAEAARALDPPPLPAGSYTEIKAEIWLSGDLSSVLERHGVGEVEWRAEERRQASSIADEIREGKSDLALALADALREARKTARKKGLGPARSEGAEPPRAQGDPP